MDQEDLAKHVREEHNFSPFSTYLKEIVYGGTDGIVSTFAVVAGFAGARGSELNPTLPIIVVLLFGFANLFADAMSMGLSNFLSLRSEQDLYRGEKAKEAYEVKNNPQQERAETVAILMGRGFPRKDAEQLTEIYSKNPKYWTDFMMRYELEMPNPEHENPYFTASATFLAFITFGFAPLSPYVFMGASENKFLFSAISSFLALVILGIIRRKVTKETTIRSVGEIVFVGSIAAGIAYLVGTFFRF